MFKTIELKLGTMRKPQRFVVEQSDKGNIYLSSTKAIGKFDAETGVGKLNINGSTFMHLNMPDAKPYTLPADVLAKVKELITPVGSSAGGMIYGGLTEIGSDPEPKPAPEAPAQPVGVIERPQYAEGQKLTFIRSKTRPDQFPDIPYYVSKVMTLPYSSKIAGIVVRPQDDSNKGRYYTMRDLDTMIEKGVFIFDNVPESAIVQDTPEAASERFDAELAKVLPTEIERELSKHYPNYDAQRVASAKELIDDFAVGDVFENPHSEETFKITAISRGEVTYIRPHSATTDDRMIRAVRLAVMILRGILVYKRRVEIAEIVPREYNGLKAGDRIALKIDGQATRTAVIDGMDSKTVGLIYDGENKVTGHFLNILDYATKVDGLKAYESYKVGDVYIMHDYFDRRCEIVALDLSADGNDLFISYKAVDGDKVVRLHSSWVSAKLAAKSWSLVTLDERIAEVDAELELRRKLFDDVKADVKQLEEKRSALYDQRSDQRIDALNSEYERKRALDELQRQGFERHFDDVKAEQDRLDASTFAAMFPESAAVELCPNCMSRNLAVERYEKRRERACPDCGYSDVANNNE